MPVQQHVLNWLYSVLTSEYHDVNRTYNDVAHALTRYPSLAPRTDVYTFPNGASALLLHLSGTLPVNFRGTTYRFPMSIWVPHAYPREPPLVYVTPTDNMMVRPGQHVDPQGQVYHPYLVGWAEFWDKSTLHDFLTILSDVFAKEPPVISRQQPRPTQSPQPVQSPPPVPPLPPEMAPRPVSREQPRPPPPPPKTVQQDSRMSSASRESPAPSLPPVPATSSPSVSRSTSRYDSAPPLPPEAQARSFSRTSVQSHGQQQYQSRLPPSPQQQRYSHASDIPPPVASSQLPRSPPQPLPPQFHQGPPVQAHAQGQWQPAGPQNHHPPPPPWSEAVRPMQSQPAPPPPPPDLLDEPLTLDIPAQSSVAPPPIPPNPEKDAMLRQLAQTLASMRQRSRQQNESSMAGLQAQRNAMLAVIPTMQSEMGQLTQLSNVLNSNSAILHDALHKADGVIEGSRNHPAPDIDELLVAPTVVSNQLYTLVAEERALGDAIFMLGRAVERGRISPAVFAKMTRSLAREWYLKKALVRKIGLGMGLAS